LVPFQNFPSADGWIVVNCPKEKFWQRLTEVIGRQELAEDPRFQDYAKRSKNAPELLAILFEEFRKRSSAEWLEKLTDAGVPCSAINSIAEALTEEHTAARGMIVETDHPVFGTIRQPASPVRVGPPPESYRRAPRRNEDARYVLEELLKYDPHRIAQFQHAGAFGAPRNEAE
jgi:crotonobetainyl-CoA:carnitine CoA-transferase CaiB-like acyl-CoA transferase